MSACALLAPPHAGAAVYWGSPLDGVGAANLDGNGAQWDYFYSPYGSTQGPACAVAVNSEYLYWATPGGIARRKLDGENVYPWTVVPSSTGPCGLALDQGHVYWADSGWRPSGAPQSGSIGRTNLDGSEPNGAFVTGLEDPCDVAVDGGRVYWVEDARGGGSDGIGRSNIDGSSPERAFIPFPTWNYSCGLAASGDYLYWGQDESIARANLEGDETDEAFIPNAGRVEGIAVQAGHIYWAAEWPDRTSSIGRANLDGSEADPHWIATPERGLGGVAVDERPAPPNLLLPSQPVSIVPNVEYNLRSGAVRLRVYVPPHARVGESSLPRGQLTVSSPGLNWKVFSSTERIASQGGSYLWWVRIRPGKGRAGKRIRSELRKRGWARVRLRLAYEEARVYPVETTRGVILRQYHGASRRWIKHPHPPKKRYSS